MKKLVTFRLDPALLAKAKGRADADNRTLTNFVETVLKMAVEAQQSDEAQATQPPPGRRPHRKAISRTGATD